MSMIVFIFHNHKRVENEFEQLLSKKISGKINFMGQIQHFLGMKFESSKGEQGKLNIMIAQTAFIETIAALFNINEEQKVHMPYKSGMLN